MLAPHILAVLENADFLVELHDAVAEFHVASVFPRPLAAGDALQHLHHAPETERKPEELLAVAHKDLPVRKGAECRQNQAEMQFSNHRLDGEKQYFFVPLQDGSVTAVDVVAAKCLRWQAIGVDAIGKLPNSKSRMFSRRARKVFANRVAPAFKRLFRREILVFGDSHAQVFHHERVKGCMPGCFFNVYRVGGATASGLANPNSKTRAYRIFRSALEKTRARAAVVMLGEVDTGFVIWYRAQKYNEPVATMLDATLETYTNFLSEIRSRGLGVVVVSTPLPTIQDDNDWGEIAKARKEVMASLRERTDLTLEFNRRVKAFCAGQGMAFVDLDPLSLDESGVVAPRLLSPDRNDHHYEVGVYAEMLAPLLAKALADVAGKGCT